MKPVVKVFVIVAIVLVVIHIVKQAMIDKDDSTESFVSFMDQEFETVPPQPPFTVTPVPLVVNNSLTATPILTQVATELPAVVPTMVPTFVPSVVPVKQVVTGLPSRTPAVVTGLPSRTPAVVTYAPTATPTLITIRSP